MATVSMTVNGKAVSGVIEGRTLLVEFLRQGQRLTGTHVGCDTSQCGACVVHVNGAPVKSCTMFAAEAEGAEVATSKVWPIRMDPCRLSSRRFRIITGFSAVFARPAW